MRVDLYKGTFTEPNCYPAKSLELTFRDYVVKSQFWAFGRDVPYNNPPCVREYGIRHIHLITTKEYQQYEANNIRLHDRTSDKHLIYARSPIDNDHYLLIAIVDPNAHSTANNNNFMYKLHDVCKQHFG